MKTGNDRTPETVTIVMPVYNPGKYLAPCLDSLLAQTFGDFRLIAIDDGSTDGSGDVLRAYAAKDDRILAWKNPENLGAARTRNIGIQMAKGKYLSVVDADDFYEPDYLETMVGAMERYQVDVAECDFYFRDESAGTEVIASPPEYLRKWMQGRFLPEHAAAYLFSATHNPPYVHMYRRLFVSEYALQFQDIPSCNDVFFSNMSFALAKTAIHVYRPLLHYRYNTGQQISKNRLRMMRNLFRSAAALQKGLETHGLFERYGRAFRDFVVREEQVHFSDAGQSQEAAEALVRGFQSIGMTNLTGGDFQSPMRYAVWKGMRKGGLPTAEEILQVVYAELFRRLSSHCRKVALWGYGVNGKRFLEEAQRCSFPIHEVYDRDPQKWDAAMQPPVKPFAGRDSGVDAVIVTNSSFYPEIEKTVHAQEPWIYVLDFMTFYQFGWQGRDIKVSVIIPVYNVENYLADCLDSVLAQDFEDMEILCVEDGSTDGSRTILKAYAQKDARMRIIEYGGNRGLAYARNRGMEQARGRYLFFLDSDDKMMPGCLSAIYEKMEREQLDALSYDAVNEYEDGVDPARVPPYGRHKARYDRTMTGQEFFARSWRKGELFLNACQYSWRTGFLRQHRFMFHEGILHEDDPFTFRALMHARRVRCVSLDGYVYRRRSKSITMVSFSQKHAEGLLADLVDFEQTVQGMEQEACSAECLEAIREFQASRERDLRMRLLQVTDARIGSWRFPERAQDIWFRKLLKKAYRYLQGYIRPGMQENVKAFSSIIVYGTGGVGREVMALLEEYGIRDFLPAVTCRPHALVQGFSANANELRELRHLRDDAMVIVAVTEKWRDELKGEAEKLGFRHIVWYREIM